MTTKIYIITSDNVFFLLLSSFIKAQNKNIRCIKVMEYSLVEIESYNAASIIIVDGTMTLISPIALIYNLRYALNIVSPIWLFSDIVFPDYIVKTKEVGTSEVIYKPFDPIETSKKINQFVLKQK